MDVVRITRQLWELKRWVAVGSLLAFFIALNTAYGISILPPGVHKKSLELGAAKAKLYVDSAHTTIIDLGSPKFGAPDLRALSARATLVANLMNSPAVLEQIGRSAGIPWTAIHADAPTNANVPTSVTEQNSAQRGNTLLSETNEYRLSFFAEPQLPVVTISAQAPSAAAALRLANGAVVAAQQFLARLGGPLPGDQRLTAEPLGPATGGLVNPGINVKVVSLAFVALFVMVCTTVMLLSSVIRRWRYGDAIADAYLGDGEFDSDDAPPPTVLAEPGAESVRERSAIGA